MSTKTIQKGLMHLERLFGSADVSESGDEYVVYAGTYDKPISHDAQIVEKEAYGLETLAEVRFLELKTLLAQQGIDIEYYPRHNEKGHDTRVEFVFSKQQLENVSTVCALEKITPADIDPMDRGSTLPSSTDIFIDTQQSRAETMRDRLNNITGSMGIKWAITGSEGNESISTLLPVSNPCAVIEALERSLHTNITRPAKGIGKVTIPVSLLERDDAGARLGVLVRMGAELKPATSGMMRSS